ncbi:helix-turn-helix domain-containing protein [Vibrio sp. TBV020]|uniref:helix-turn-helix domain-containing protein n=1 Tax=Vibrio sp. TBV020 TaxID=3137398 RepID=UPI0038CD5426
MTGQQSTISQNIQKRMTDLGIRNKVELSEKSGVSRTVVTNIINMPNKSVMIDSAIKLARALKCRVEWLCDGTGPINDDYLEEKFRITEGVPLLQLSDIDVYSAEEILEEFIDNDKVERIPCSAGNNNSTFAIKLTSISYRTMLGKYERSGMLFFDCQAKPFSGQWVLVKISEDATPEIMEYISVQGRQFLKSLEADIPEELQRLEITDQIKVIATKVSYAINE